MTRSRFTVRRVLVWIAITCVVLVGARVSWHSWWSTTRLMQVGDRIIARVEAHKSATGGYPTTLTVAGIPTPYSPYGGWRYWASDDHAQFALALGDYFRDGFLLEYTSQSGNWQVDQ
jgi:hypothetical protein